MTEIPNWWLGISAGFFVLGTIAFIATTVVLVYVLKAIKEIQPQIIATTKRIENVAERVEEVSNSVKVTVDELSAKAKGIATTTEGAVGKVATAAAANSPWIAGAMTVFKLYQAYQAVRGAKQAKAAKALPSPNKG